MINLKKVKFAKSNDNDIIVIDPKDNKNFYFQLIEAILFSLYSEKMINQIQYELCKKELYNKKHNL